MSEDFFNIEFAENSDPRLPIVLITDVSDSMSIKRGNGKRPIDELNGGLDVLVTELNKDPLAKRRAEVSVVAYGTEVSDATPFATVDDLVLPTLVESGRTSTGKAIEVALDALEERKKEIRENGIELYRPIVILLSDGLSTDDIKKSVKRVQEGESKKKFTFFAIAVEGADLEQLGKFSENRPALQLKETNFSEFFQWLSASAASVSASQPGETGVKMPSPAGWADLEV